MIARAYRFSVGLLETKNLGNSERFVVVFFQL